MTLSPAHTVAPRRASNGMNERVTCPGPIAIQVIPTTARSDPPTALH